MLRDFTHKKILCKNVRLLSNMFSQGTGLMFRSSSSVYDTAWIFVFPKPRRDAITMWFVFFSIDVILLDSEKKIISFKTLHPWQTCVLPMPVRFIVEVEEGFVRKNRLKIGQKLSFELKK